MKNAVFSLFAIAATANAGKVLSTVFETEVQTITSCAPAVTDCPAAHKTIVHTYTSECDEETKPYPTHVYTSEEHKKAYTLSTVTETKEYTITSCAPTVTNCPVGHVTTTVEESTTLCPVTEYPHQTYPAGGNATYYPPPPPPANTGSPYPSKPVVVVPPPVLSTITVSTCVPTYITKVITVTGEGPHATAPAGCPGGYNCPAEGGNGMPSAPAENQPTAPAQGCPGGYNCPAENTPIGTAAPTGAYYTKPVEFAGSASTQRAGGLLLAVGLAAIALF